MIRGIVLVAIVGILLVVWLGYRGLLKLIDMVATLQRELGE